MRIQTLATPELGDRTYVVDDGVTAVVIDPQRDLDRLDDVLEHDPGLVLETHVHNDYVSGGPELARRSGAAYGVNAADDVAFDREPLRDGQELTVGSLSVTVLATPGHTPTHLSYVVRDLADPLAAPAVFSGGSLLYGTVGRTDLVDPALTHELAVAQLRSAQRLAGLPAEAALFPTHGFGSFCAGGAGSGAEASTIADELDKNDALRGLTVEELIASFTAYPAYYAHMAPLNRAGAPVLDLTSPLPRAHDGVRRVDVRPAAEFAAAHERGALSVVLGSQFATHVGWLTPWGEPLALVAASDEELADARRQLGRIGITDLSAAPPSGTSSYRRATFDELAAEVAPDDVVLDVRRDEEHADERVRGATHVPLHELEQRVAEVAGPGRVWVHCGAGIRAGTAASMLEGYVGEVVHVDDGFARAVELGLTER